MPPEHMNNYYFDTDTSSTDDSAVVINGTDTSTSSTDIYYTDDYLENDSDEESVVYEEYIDLLINHSINNDHWSDALNEEDHHHFYSEKEHNKYYIGLHYYNSYYNYKYPILASTLSNNLFFKYPFPVVLRYLQLYNLHKSNKPILNIMKLDIKDDDTHSVVIKTYWIRLIQRHWKKRYQKILEFINIMKNPSSIKYSQIHGRLPNNINMSECTIHGMLSQYAKITC